MAEAAVEERPPNPRFFCHKCSVEFEHASPEYTCPHCLGGFIEELEANADPSDEVIDVDDEEDVNATWANPVNILLDDFDRRLSRPRYVHDPARRRRTFTRIPSLRTQTPFESLLQDFILNLGVGWGRPNQVPGNMFFLGNPGDYAWGRDGLDAIVTQLLNQIDGTGPPPLSKEVIQAIPTVTVTQEQVDAKVQCSVCWEDFVLNESVRKLPCQHVYHENCICPWLELHGTCPICRQNLAPGSDTHESNLAALHEIFQAVHGVGQNVSGSEVPCPYIPSASSSDTASTSSSSSSSATSSSSSSSSTSAASSDRHTTGSTSSDCNTDLELN